MTAPAVNAVSAPKDAVEDAAAAAPVDAIADSGALAKPGAGPPVDAMINFAEAETTLRVEVNGVHIGFEGRSSGGGRFRDATWEGAKNHPANASLRSGSNDLAFTFGPMANPREGRVRFSVHPAGFKYPVFLYYGSGAEAGSFRGTFDLPPKAPAAPACTVRTDGPGQVAAFFVASRAADLDFRLDGDVVVAAVPFNAEGDYVVLPNLAKGKHTVEIDYKALKRPNDGPPALSILAVLPGGTREAQLPIDGTKRTTKFDFEVM